MTDKEYRRHLAAIEKSNPDEPLLRTLQQGFSRVNLIYMRAALKRLPPAADTVEPSADDMPGENMPPVVRELWAHKGRLFRERARWSNKFHDAKNDQERKAISDAILRIWNQIQDIERKIGLYEQTGSLPGEEERFPLPDDPVLLVRKTASIRSLISIQQAKLRDLAKLPESDPTKPAKIEEANAKLAELKLYRSYAERKIQENIHS